LQKQGKTTIIVYVVTAVALLTRVGLAVSVRVITQHERVVHVGETQPVA